MTDESPLDISDVHTLTQPETDVADVRKSSQEPPRGWDEDIELDTAIAQETRGLEGRDAVDNRWTSRA